MKKAARQLFCILAAGLTAMAPAAIAQGTQCCLSVQRLSIDLRLLIKPRAGSLA